MKEKKICRYCNKKMNFVENGEFFKCSNCGAIKKKKSEIKFSTNTKTKTVGW